MNPWAQCATCEHVYIERWCQAPEFSDMRRNPSTGEMMNYRAPCIADVNKHGDCPYYKLKGADA